MMHEESNNERERADRMRERQRTRARERERSPSPLELRRAVLYFLSPSRSLSRLLSNHFSRRISMVFIARLLTSGHKYDRLALT
jgi:hypothetical protein